MSIKEAYEKKLQGQLDEWGAEIDKLKAKADSAKADAQLEYYKQIEDLRSMKDAASKKLDELKEAGDDAWEDLKAGIDSAWDSLSSSVKSAVSRFSDKD
jgi:chromosome segregation ATPase